jgi:hypothetical protein
LTSNLDRDSLRVAAGARVCRGFIVIRTESDP